MDFERAPVLVAFRRFGIESAWEQAARRAAKQLDQRRREGARAAAATARAKATANHQQESSS
jgi:hypothetical protein